MTTKPTSKPPKHQPGSPSVQKSKRGKAPTKGKSASVDFDDFTPVSPEWLIQLNEEYRCGQLDENKICRHPQPYRIRDVLPFIKAIRGVSRFLEDNPDLLPHPIVWKYLQNLRQWYLLDRKDYPANLDPFQYHEWAEDELLLCLDAWVKAFFPEYTVVAKDPKRHKKHLSKRESHWISPEPESVDDEDPNKKNRVLIELTDYSIPWSDKQILKDYEKALAKLNRFELTFIPGDNDDPCKQKKRILEKILPAVWKDLLSRRYLKCDPFFLVGIDPLEMDDDSWEELEYVPPFPLEEARAWVDEAFAQAGNAGHSVIRDHIAYCMVGYIHQTRDPSQTVIPRTANQVKNIIERMRKLSKLRFSPASSTST